MVLQDLILVDKTKWEGAVWRYCCVEVSYDSTEFKQPLGCFFFSVLPLSLPFSGRAGSDHSGSALGGGLWLPDHPAQRAGQARAVLAPLSHQYLPHQVRSLPASLWGGWKSAWFFTCQSHYSSLDPGNVFLNPSESLCSVGTNDQWCGAGLHCWDWWAQRCTSTPLWGFVISCAGMRMAEGVPINSRWPAIPSKMWTTGGLSKILECEYARVLTSTCMLPKPHQGLDWTGFSAYGCRSLVWSEQVIAALCGKSIAENSEILSELLLPERGLCWAHGELERLTRPVEILQVFCMKGKLCFLKCKQWC